MKLSAYSTTENEAIQLQKMKRLTSKTVADFDFGKGKISRKNPPSSACHALGKGRANKRGEIMRQRIRRIEKALADSGLDVQDVKRERDKLAFERAIQEFLKAFGVIGPAEFVGMFKRDGIKMEDASMAEMAEYLRAKVRAKAEGLQNEP